MSEEENTQETGTGSQIDIARELSSVLEQVSSRLERIQKLTQTQADFVNQMTQNFQNMTNSFSQMADSSEEIRGSLEQVVNHMESNFNQERMQNLNDEFEKIADNCTTMTETHTDALKDTNNRVQNLNQTTNMTNEGFKKSTDSINVSLKSATDAINNLLKGTLGVSKETFSFAEALRGLKEKIDSFMNSYGKMIKNALSAGLTVAKGVFSVVSSLVGAASKFVKFAATLPFTIAKYAANIGFTIRQQLVEVIQTASEALKEKFDMDSSIGRGIEAMTKRGKGMLLAFQNPSAELVKLFGFGAEGIANMIGFMGENIEAMGHFSEVFGESLMNNGPRLKNFARMVKGFGFTSEDVAYMAQDAGVNMKHIEVRMAELGVTLESTSHEFGVDRKRLSKNFMIMRKDITQFGHLSDEEIARTTARLTQMRVNLEDASAVFKKFSTFEDAANSVAMLSQAFGMNLNAMDIIQAKNPEDIIDMFRNSMLETGRSFSDLNRFEKELMAQHTGMSAESLNALMNYRNLGLTHEEAVRRMEAKKPEAKQMAALKKLNSAIKEVQKVLKFDSPFKAFFDGLSKNTALSGDLKSAVLSLSQGYEGIYKFALKLNPKTWEGLIDPIVMIINAMRSIFQSKEFKDGLVGALSTVSKFVGSLFGVTEGDSILSRITRNVKIGFGKGGRYHGDAKEKENFKNIVFKGMKNRSEVLKSYLDSDQIKALKKIDDPAELLNQLQKIKSGISGKKTSVHKAFDEMFKQIAIQIQNQYDKSEKKAVTKDKGKSTTKLVTRDSVNILSTGLTEVINKNKNNVGNLFSLSGRVAGAILKGGAIGFVGILKVINTQFKKYKEKKDQEGPEAQDNSMIEDFLGFEPGEFSKLGESISSAFLSFMENADSTTSIFGWLLGGIKDVFMLAGGFFYNTLKTGLMKLLGFGNLSSTSELMKTQSSDFMRPQAGVTIKNISKAKEEGEDVTTTDAVNMYYELQKAIRENKSNLSEENLSKLNLASSTIASRLKDDTIQASELTQLTQNMLTMHGQLISKNKKQFDMIEKFHKTTIEYDRDKSYREGNTIDAYKKGGARGAAYSAGTIPTDVVGGIMKGTGTATMLSSPLISGLLLGSGIAIAKAVAGGAGLSAAVGGLSAGAIGAGALTAGLGPILIGAAVIGGLGYLAYTTGQGIQDYGRNTDVDAITTSVNDYASSSNFSQMKSIDSKLIGTMFKGAEPVNESLQETFESNTAISSGIATASVDSIFGEVSSAIKVQSNRMPREEYERLTTMFNDFRKEFSELSSLELSPSLIFDSDVISNLIKSLVPAGLYSYFFDPALSQGVLQPTENGVPKHPALQDGALNTVATLEYDSRYS